MKKVQKNKTCIETLEEITINKNKGKYPKIKENK